MNISTQEIVAFTSILCSTSSEVCSFGILMLNDDIKVALRGKVRLLATKIAQVCERKKFR